MSMGDCCLEIYHVHSIGTVKDAGRAMQGIDGRYILLCLLLPCCCGEKDGRGDNSETCLFTMVGISQACSTWHSKADPASAAATPPVVEAAVSSTVLSDA